MKIADSQFIGNKTTAATYGGPNPSLRGLGGAIFTDRASARNGSGGAIDISNTTFKNNQGRGEGGAAYLYTGGKDRVSIDKSTFENNKVAALPNGGNGGNGGGLVVMSNEVNRGLTITDSNFVKNTAAGQGGGLWMMKAPAKIDNTDFSGNRVESFAKSGVGGGMALYGQADISNSTFTNNYAGWVGGAISANEDPVSVQNTTFDRNTADNGNEDWGIQQQTNRELIDKGGNTQYPPKQTNNFNDVNATANIELADAPLSANTAGDRGANVTQASIASVSNTSSATEGDNATVASDSLSGGADTVIGGGNNDLLTGNVGTDSFAFDSPNLGVTQIVNFDPADDTILISASGFGGGLIANTGLTASQFAIASSATDAEDRFIYDRASGVLSFDKDGAGGSKQVQIATLSDRPSLTNADIAIAT
jgi:Ca2+-binding RTX toxin-like protein